MAERRPTSTRCWVVALVVLVGAVVLVACSSAQALRETEWARVERVRGSVKPPSGYASDYESRRGGEGCSWRLNCDTDVVSTIEYVPADRPGTVPCGYLKKTLDEQVDKVFLTALSDPETCVLVGKLDGLDVVVTLYRRTARIRVEAGEFDHPYPHTVCDHPYMHPEDYAVCSD